jgi:hypothetical protein
MYQNAKAVLEGVRKADELRQSKVEEPSRALVRP